MTVLETTRDLRGNQVTVKHTNTIGGTDVMTFFAKQFVELYKLGWAHPSLVAKNNSKAVYVEIDGKVAGHIVYNFLNDSFKTAWICLSAVDPAYRQCGLYKIMHRHFEEQIQKEGSSRISSYVHVDNDPRIRGCEAVGLVPKFYKMEKIL